MTRRQLHPKRTLAVLFHFLRLSMWYIGYWPVANLLISWMPFVVGQYTSRHFTTAGRVLTSGRFASVSAVPP